MAGADGRRGIATGLLLALALLVATPPGALHAADELATQILPGDAHAASVVDLDGDGANELVRIVADEASGHVAEAWQAGAEGWTLLGAASIPRLDAAGVEQGVLRGIDTSATLLWHLDGRARVLVLARWGPRSIDATEVECCFSMFELVWRSGAVTLEPRTAEGGGADLVHAFDADADGTDELLLNGFYSPDSFGEVEVLRWDGEAFRSVYLEQNPEGIGNLMIADSDGVEGDDILIGPMASGALRRIVWEDGAFVLEEGGLLDFDERNQPFISGIADGALVLTLPAQLQIVRWPRGETPITEARLSGGEWPYAGIVDAGPDTLLVVQDQVSSSSPPDATVYDLELRELGRITPPRVTSRVAALFNELASYSGGLERYLFPYSGPLPGASPRTNEGLAWGGLLVNAGVDGFETSPIAPMAGLWPIGLAGAGDGWMALNSGYLYTGRMAALYGGIQPPGYGRTSMVPIDDLLRADDSAATVNLRGAVALERQQDGVTSVVAGGDGFEAVVTAPAGSWIAAWDGSSLDEQTVEGASVVLEFAAPRRGERDKDQPIDDAWLIIATPDGRATVREWVGTFVRQPPELTVTGRTELGQPSAALQGTVGPHTMVAIDGRPVPVDARGRFEASVDAVPWPHRVDVVATDLLGNEVVERIEVVGLYDYRGLPWAAIVAVATLSVGAVLFFRIPRRRRAAATEDGDDDGRLEELEPIDGGDILRP